MQDHNIIAEQEHTPVMAHYEALPLLRRLAVLLQGDLHIVIKRLTLNVWETG